MQAYQLVRQNFDCQLVLAGGSATDDLEGQQVLAGVQELVHSVAGAAFRPRFLLSHPRAAERMGGRTRTRAAQFSHHPACAGLFVAHAHGRAGVSAAAHPTAGVFPPFALRLSAQCLWGQYDRGRPRTCSLR